MAIDDKNIQSFTQQLIKWQEENKKKTLSVDQLKELAGSIGFSEQEWNELLKTADQKVVLADNYFKTNNFKDAYDEASSALSINPNLTQAYHIASQAALGLYNKTTELMYLQHAEQYADAILERNPNDKKALGLMATIRGAEDIKKQRKKEILIYGSIGASVLAIILILIFVVKPAKKDNSKIKNQADEIQLIKNQLIETQEAAKSQWAQLQNVINRRDQMLPQLLNLINTNDPQVSQILNEINNLQEQIKNADDQQKIQLQYQLQQKFTQLTPMIRKINNSKDVELVLVQIEGTYNRINVEAQRYNQAVKTYNILLRQNSGDFPEFKEIKYFEGN